MENEPLGSSQRFSDTFRQQSNLALFSLVFSPHFNLCFNLQEPPLRLRYESPINASPSRFRDHPRPFDYEDPELDRTSAHRSSLGRSIGTLPSYNGMLFHSMFLFLVPDPHFKSLFYVFVDFYFIYLLLSSRSIVFHKVFFFFFFNSFACFDTNKKKIFVVTQSTSSRVHTEVFHFTRQWSPVWRLSGKFY